MKRISGWRFVGRWNSLSLMAGAATYWLRCFMRLRKFCQVLAVDVGDHAEHNACLDLFRLGVGGEIWWRVFR